MKKKCKLKPQFEIIFTNHKKNLLVLQAGKKLQSTDFYLYLSSPTNKGALLLTHGEVNKDRHGLFHCHSI